MSFTDAIRTCFARYFQFSGRASRPEYWWFVLFCFLGNAIASTLEGMINGMAGGGGPTILSSAFALVTFIPQISAGWRRMHDTGRSGLYLLYPLIVMVGMATFAGLSGSLGFLVPGPEDAPDPFEGVAQLILLLTAFVFLISPLLVIWWLSRPSQPGSNEYGPNPSEVMS